MNKNKAFKYPRGLFYCGIFFMTCSSLDPFGYMEVHFKQVHSGILGIGLVYGLGVGKLKLSPAMRIIYAIALVVIALPGLIYNKWLNVGSSYFTGVANIMWFIVPGIVVEERAGKHSSITWLEAERALVLVANVYLAASVIALFLHAGGYVEAIPHIHERFILALPGIALALSNRRYFQSFCHLLLLAIIVGIDARSTMVLMSAIILFAPFAPKWISGKLYLAPIILISGIFAGIEGGMIWSINSSIKEALGGTDNNLFRELMAQTAYNQIRESPIVGTMFAGPTAIFPAPEYTELMRQIFHGQSARIHNDYLEIAIVGGLAYLLAFLALIVYCLKRSCHFSANGSRAHKMLNFVIVAYLAAMAFNPLLGRARSGMPFYFLLSIVTAGCVCGQKVGFRNTIVEYNGRNVYHERCCE